MTPRPPVYGLRDRFRSLPRWGRRTFWWSLVALFAISMLVTPAHVTTGVERDRARQTCTRIWGSGSWMSYRTGTAADRLAVQAVIDNCVLNMVGDPAAVDQTDFARQTADGLRPR